MIKISPLLGFLLALTIALPLSAAPTDFSAKPPADAMREPSGLASKILIQGKGNKPDGNDLVSVSYIGWTPEGVEFQNTYPSGKPRIFNLTKVFPGWRQGLLQMQVGEKRRLWIPAHLGPPSSKEGPRASVFDVELLGIKRVPNSPGNLQRPATDAERTLSGAFTKKISSGNGTVKPKPDGRVLLNYTGWTVDGQTFDSTTTRGRPTAFFLDKVMAPFSEAVQQMVEGEKRQLWVPANLAAGQWPGAPQGMLIFELELLKIFPDKPAPSSGDSGP